MTSTTIFSSIIHPFTTIVIIPLAALILALTRDSLLLVILGSNKNIFFHGQSASDNDITYIESDDEDEDSTHPIHDVHTPERSGVERKLDFSDESMRHATPSPYGRVNPMICPSCGFSLTDTPPVASPMETPLSSPKPVESSSKKIEISSNRNSRKSTLSHSTSRRRQSRAKSQAKSVPPIEDIILAFTALKNESFHSDPNDPNQIQISISTEKYATASETIMPVMALLGVAFSFASKDLGTRVKKLNKVSPAVPSLQELVKADSQSGQKWVKVSVIVVYIWESK